jgi:hypothetical protein
MERRECEMNACATDMNENRANRFPLRRAIFLTIFFNKTFFKTGVGCRPYLLQKSTQEIAMTSFRTARIPRLAFATASTVTALLWAGAAFASQGPGGGVGTASSFTQLAMAVIVYGASALVVGTGLIGAARRR